MTSRRRAFSALLPAALLSSLAKNSFAEDILISDTHSHSALSPRNEACLSCELNAHRVTLVSWALGSDGPFIQRLPSGAMQVNLKATPEQYQETFLRQLGGMFARIRREQIRIVRNAQDVDRALAGELRLVISTEGAHYLGGDIAYLDRDGYVRITDRLKDVIKIGGEWISSQELESALSRHEGVKEVAVVAKRDPKWDERPWAEVVLRDGAAGGVTPRDLSKHLHRVIDDGTIHKRAVLTEIRIVDALPKTSVGKIDKKEIRRRIAAG